MTPEPTTTVGPSADRFLQLHIAEYNALTTRSTYYITISASLVPVIVIFLALVAQMWSNPYSKHALLIWPTGVAIQFFLLAMIANAQVQYQNIKYIEKVLRPLIGPLLQPPSGFWRYERYLSDQRRGAQWWEYTPAVGAAVTVGAAIAGRLLDPAQRSATWDALDWVGVGFNALFLVVAFWNSFKVVALRRSIF